MNPYGNGSDGNFNVSTGTHYLLLNREYQYQNFTLGDNAILETSSIEGSALVIKARGTIEISGTVNLVQAIKPGSNNNPFFQIAGYSFAVPTASAGGRGSGFVGQTRSQQNDGFGGGGGGVGFIDDNGNIVSGGNGGDGSRVNPGPTTTGVAVTANTNQVLLVPGKDGVRGAGGSGGAYATFTRTSGNVTGRVYSGLSGVGGAAYGISGSKGQPGTPGNQVVTGGSGNSTYSWGNGGGGGAGGVAGISSPTLFLCAPNVIINGIVIQSGSDGGKGGNGGRGRDQSGDTIAYGGGGGGGGGGFGGMLRIVYGNSISNSVNHISLGGLGGEGGSGSSNNATIAESGQDGLDGDAQVEQAKPFSAFTATPLTGQRPLTVNFANTSLGADSYLWEFGDGTTSTATNPSHTYTGVSNYIVFLTAYNEAGDSTSSRTIQSSIQSFNAEAKGTLLYVGGVDEVYRALREAEGTIKFGGQASAIIRRDPTAIESKTYLAKVYDESNNYVETWGGDIISDPQFTREINSLGSTMTLELARNSDSLGQNTEPLLTEDGEPITTEDGYQILAATESRNQVGNGSSVNYNNRVDIYVFYGSVEPLLTESGEEITTEDGELILATLGAPNGVRIFTGFINGITQRFGTSETTVISVDSYGFDLDQFEVTNGSGLTTVTYNSTDPGVIARSLMNQFAIDSASYNTFTRSNTDTIPLTGTSVSYTFKIQKYSDAIKKTLELMPSDWFFRVGLGDNLLYFGKRQTTPKHLFVKGLHFESFELAGNIANSTNKVIFTGGGDPALFRKYEATPASRTRRTLELYSDNRVTLSQSAQIISENIINSNNKVQNKSTITILQRQYDIESIQLGDMVGFRNFGTEVDLLLLQVVGITYHPDYVVLQLDQLPLTVNKRLEDIRRNLTVSDNQNVPNQPS